MSIYAAAITLFLVMDPLGNIPVFLGLLGSVDPARRRIVIVREMLIALVILAAFLFFGRYIMQGMYISQPALSIGGGVVLFLIALRMIFPNRQASVPAAGTPTAGASPNGASAEHGEEPLIVPMAIPLIAGPSSMATLILFSTQQPDRIGDWLIALVVAWMVAAVILLSAETLRRVLGRRGLAAMERLMGMILTTMAVQMLLSGIEMFVATLPDL